MIDSGSGGAGISGSTGGRGGDIACHNRQGKFGYIVWIVGIDLLLHGH